jgi:hypothetical protein
VKVIRRPWLIIAVPFLFALVILAGVLVFFPSPFDIAARQILIDLSVGVLGSALIFLWLERFLNQVVNADGRTRGFDYADYVRRMAKSKEKIRILVTFTNLLTMKPDYARVKHDFFETLEKLLVANPEIFAEILILDPFTDAADQRDAERQDESVIDRIQENLMELYKRLTSPETKELYSRVKVKVYDRLPPFSFFQLDGMATIAFYRRNTTIEKSPQFTFEMKTPLGKFMDDVFLNIWADQDASKDIFQYVSVHIKTTDKTSGDVRHHSLHFVKRRHVHNIYVLLSALRDREAHELLINQDLDVDVYWKGKPIRCKYRERKYIHDSLELPTLISKKFGTIEHSSIVELQMADENN